MNQDIHQWLLINISQFKLALPLGQVQLTASMVAICPLPAGPPFVLGLIDVHGTLLPVIDLSFKFHVPPRSPLLSDCLVVVNTSRRSLALKVDRIEGIAPFSSEDLDSSMDRFQFHGDAIKCGPALNGIAKSRKGVIFLFDVETFLTVQDESYLQTILQENRGPSC